MTESMRRRLPERRAQAAMTPIRRALAVIAVVVAWLFLNPSAQPKSTD